MSDENNCKSSLISWWRQKRSAFKTKSATELHYADIQIKKAWKILRTAHTQMGTQYGLYRGLFKTASKSATQIFAN
jgi:hypothetical protein